MIEKPVWLENVLASWHWKIFTWDIDIGGSIENFIDWLLSPINALVEWADKIGAFVLDLIYEIRDFFAQLLARIEQVWQSFVDWIANIWQLLDTWWQAKVELIIAFVNNATAWIKTAYDNLLNMVDRLSVAWDYFVNTILPDLASRLDVVDIIEVMLGPIRDMLNFILRVADELRVFLNNPWEWLLERFESWFFGGE